MKAPIVEIFSSFQGEGILLGKRQIFIRFAGCNLDCNYCDTSISKSNDFGINMSLEEVITKIQELKTPDLHSISLTGGEPLLHINFINELIEKTDFRFLLETNGTLHKSLAKLSKLNYVSLDIKLPEHFFNDNTTYENTEDFWQENIFENEIKSLKLLIEEFTNIPNIYCKIVVLPSSNIKTIENIVKAITQEIPEDIEIPIVIQPSSPLENWKNHQNILFKFSEIVGKYNSVSTIPQMHKILNIE